MHVGIGNPWWRGKRSRHSGRMSNPQFYVSGKRPMLIQPPGYVPRHTLCRLSNVGSFAYPQVALGPGYMSQPSIERVLCRELYLPLLILWDPRLHWLLASTMGDNYVNTHDAMARKCMDYGRWQEWYHPPWWYGHYGTIISAKQYIRTMIRRLHIVKTLWCRPCLIGAND